MCCGIGYKDAWHYIDPEEVMKMNIEKLKSRYPGGKFDGWFSENRKDGDL